MKTWPITSALVKPDWAATDNNRDAMFRFKTSGSINEWFVASHVARDMLAWPPARRAVLGE